MTSTISVGDRTPSNARPPARRLARSGARRQSPAVAPHDRAATPDPYATHSTRTGGARTADRHVLCDRRGRGGARDARTRHGAVGVGGHRGQPRALAVSCLRQAGDVGRTRTGRARRDGEDLLPAVAAPRHPDHVVGGRCDGGAVRARCRRQRQRRTFVDPSRPAERSAVGVPQDRRRDPGRRPPDPTS